MPLEYDSPELKYVIPYLNKHYPDVLYDEETGEPYIADSSLIYVYMKEYKNIIECLPLEFTKDRFDKDMDIQKSLVNLGINCMEFWGFIVFIFHIYRRYSILHQTIPLKTAPPKVSIDEELQRLAIFLAGDDMCLKENTRIIINRGKGKNNIEISDHNLLKDIIKLFSLSNCDSNDFTPLPPCIIEKLYRLGIAMLNAKQKIEKNIKVSLINGRKKIEVTNSMVLQEIAHTFISADSKRDWHNKLVVSSCTFDMSPRALKYCILKTIYDEIISRPDGISFTNNEKILYLAISNLFGFKFIAVTKENGVAISQLFDNYHNYNTHISCFDMLFDTKTDTSLIKP